MSLSINNHSQISREHVPPIGARSHLGVVFDKVPVVLHGHLGAVGDPDLPEALHVVEDTAELHRLVADGQIREADDTHENHFVLRRENVTSNVADKPSEVRISDKGLCKIGTIAYNYICFRFLSPFLAEG